MKNENRFCLFSTKTLFGKREVIGFESEKLRVVEIDRKTANDIIVKNHYSGKFYSASYIHLACYINDKIVGILQFGYAMNPASMASVVASTKIDEYLELNRMWFEDGLFKNIKSMAISYSFKYIRQKFPKIKWIQSFADERCNKYGIVYQASNFEYYGEHKSTFWELDGVWYHNSLMTRNPNLSKSAKYLQDNKDRAKSTVLRQFRYIYFLKKNERKNCLLKKQTPPKHYL
jgi:hypothetical protein